MIQKEDTVNKVKVAVNGYGVIGKRVADAIRLQPDMVLVGVGDVAHDYRVKAALTHEIPIYASVPGKVDEMVQAGLPVAGTLDDLLSEGMPTLDRPVRAVSWPVMKVERPAVQLCSA